MPGAVAPDEPEPLPEWAGVYFRAFEALQHDRALGMGGAGGVPYTAISCYARDLGLRPGGDEFGRMVRMVRALDDEWLAHLDRESERRRENNRKH